MMIAPSPCAKRLTGACIVLLGIAIAPTQAFAACKPSLSVSGPIPNRTKAGAELLARATWQANANYNYGAPYAKWSKGLGKKSSCSKQSNKHVCEYTAMPCS